MEWLTAFPNSNRMCEIKTCYHFLKTTMKCFSALWSFKLCTNHRHKGWFCDMHINDHYKEENEKATWQTHSRPQIHKADHTQLQMAILQFMWTDNSSPTSLTVPIPPSSLAMCSMERTSQKPCSCTIRLLQTQSDCKKTPKKHVYHGWFYKIITVDHSIIYSSDKIPQLVQQLLRPIKISNIVQHLHTIPTILCMFTGKFI